jgi:hypothetical protein
MDVGVDIMSDRFCSDCGSTSIETYIDKRTNRPIWLCSKITGKLLCNKCYMREDRELEKIRDASFSNDPAVILGSMKSLDYLIGVMKSTIVREKGKGIKEIEREMKEHPGSKKIREMRKRMNQINTNFRKLTEDRR